MGGKQYWHILKGTFEKSKEKYESDLEDERKLFYVAITRARKNLYLSYELSTQPISCFVAESANSKYLQIDRSDLSYNPKSEKETQMKHDYEDKKVQWEEEKKQRQEYWDAVHYAKRQLYDYFGTACHFNPAARGDLMALSNMEPDQILELASRNNLI